MSRAALDTVARIATRCSTSPRCTSKGLGILYGYQSNNFLVSWLECTGMLQGVPELGTNLGPNSDRDKFSDAQLVEKSGGQGRD